MHRLIISTFLIAVFASSALAQSRDDFNGFEIFAGYSHLFIESSAIERSLNANEISRYSEERRLTDISGMKEEATGKHGVNLAAIGNVNRYLGLKFDFSTYRNRIRYENGPALPEPVIRPALTIKDLGASLYNFMGGIQVKDNGKQKIIKPFAHLHFGRVLSREEKQLDFNRLTSGELLYSERQTVTSTGFAGVAGGGLDLKFNDRLDFRLVQVDFYRSNIGSERMSGLRLGIGVVFR